MILREKVYPISESRLRNLGFLNAVSAACAALVLWISSNIFALFVVMATQSGLSGAARDWIKYVVVILVVLVVVALVIGIWAFITPGSEMTKLEKSSREV